MVFLRRICGSLILPCLLVSTCVYSADQHVAPVDYSGYVTFDAISQRRIAGKQELVAHVLKSQASRRFLTLSVTALAVASFAGVGIYALASNNNSNNEQPLQDAPARIDVAHGDRYLERRLALLDEAHTLKGMLKNSINAGFFYALSSLTTMSVIALLNDFWGISWKGVKSFVYPTTKDLCQNQKDFFKNYFSYLGRSLEQFDLELQKISTVDQFASFKKWRGLLSVEMQSSVATIIRAVEDFTALSFEFLEKLHVEVDKESLPLDLLKDFTMNIDRLLFVTDSFAKAVEQAVNEFDYAHLEQGRIQMRMLFKNLEHTARTSMAQLVELVSIL